MSQVTTIRFVGLDVPRVRPREYRCGAGVYPVDFEGEAEQGDGGNIDNRQSLVGWARSTREDDET
ncbi:hypothetical protein BH23PLA1_BH23PLA1_41130 [soil metagenome]